MESSNSSASTHPSPRLSPHHEHQSNVVLTDHPQETTCSQCHANVLSKIRYKNGNLTWLAFAGCLFLGCFCGCCLLPFCTKTFRDVEHSCPNCKYILGTHVRTRVSLSH